MGKGATTKAYIKNYVTGKRLAFMFNPEVFGDSVTINFGEVGNFGKNTGRLQYQGRSLRELPLELYYNCPEHPANLIAAETFMEAFVPPTNGNVACPSPLVLAFGRYVGCFMLTSLKRDYTQFDRALNPIEAKFSITLKEVSLNLKPATVLPHAIPKFSKNEALTSLLVHKPSVLTQLNTAVDVISTTETYSPHSTLDLTKDL